MPACLSHLPATTPCHAALLHTTCPPHTCTPLQHPPPALLPQNMHAPPAHSTSPRLHPPTALAPQEEYGGGRAPPGPLHLTTPAHVHHHFLKHPQHAFPLPPAHHHHTHLASSVRSSNTSRLGVGATKIQSPARAQQPEHGVVAVPRVHPWQAHGRHVKQQAAARWADV